MYIYVFMSFINVWYTCCRGRVCQSFVCIRFHEQSVDTIKIACLQVLFLATRQVLSLAVRFLGNSNSSLSDMIMHPIEVRPSLRLFTLLPSLRLSTSDWDSASMFPKYIKFNTNFLCNLLYIYFSVFPPFTYVTNLFSIIIYLV